MSLRLRPLTFALLVAGLSGQAHATDLMQAYELARQSDPQFAASEAQRNASQEGVVQSRSALLPQVNGDITFGDSRGRSSGNQQFAGTTTPISSSYSTGNSRGSGVSVDQSIYNHSNYTRLGSSKARAEQADATLDAASDLLIIRVADAYFNVLTAIDTLASSRAEERSVKRQLDQAEKRLEVGLAPITDVHDARARYDTSRANAITAGNLLDDAYEALAEITGQPTENLKGLSLDFRPSPLDARTGDDWVKLATETNPTLKASELALVAAEKDVSTARAGHYPTLGFRASYGDNANWGDSLTRALPADILRESGNSSTNTQFGLTLSVPIFSGFATQSRVREALYNRDVAADQLEQQKRTITRQTRNAYRSLVAGQAEVEARRLAVVSAKAAYEAGEAGLEVGTRTIVDVLIAQQQLFLARTEYSRSRHAYLVNELRLKQAAGILEATDLEATNRMLVADANAVLDWAEQQ